MLVNQMKDKFSARTRRKVDHTQSVNSVQLFVVDIVTAGNIQSDDLKTKIMVKNDLNLIRVHLNEIRGT